METSNDPKTSDPELNTPDIKRVKTEEPSDVEHTLSEPNQPKPDNASESTDKPSAPANEEAEKVDGDTVKYEYTSNDDVPVKPEYILPNDPSNKDEERVSKRTERKQKVKRTVVENRLCPFINRGETCPHGEGCKNIHDIEEFLSKQPPFT